VDAVCVGDRVRKDDGLCRLAFLCRRVARSSNIASQPVHLGPRVFQHLTRSRFYLPAACPVTVEITSRFGVYFGASNQFFLAASRVSERGCVDIL